MASLDELSCLCWAAIRDHTCEAQVGAAEPLTWWQWKEGGRQKRSSTSESPRAIHNFCFESSCSSSGFRYSPATADLSSFNILSVWGLRG